MFQNILLQVCFLFSLTIGCSLFGQTEVFIENNGQITDQFGVPRTDIHYKYSFGQQTLFLRNDGFDIVSSLTKNDTEVTLSRIEFVFRDFHATTIQAIQPTLYSENVATGTTVISSESCEEVLFKDDNSNISIRYYSNEDGFKYDIILPSQSSNHQFSVDVKGGDVSIDNEELRIKGIDYEFVETMPSVYTVRNEKKLEKQAKYSSTLSGYQIEVDKAFDEEVIIDPFLTYATYYGGTSNEKIQAVSIAGNDNTYIAGYTSSSNNIATIGAYQTVLSGYGNMFLVKFDSLNQRIWGTYYPSVSSNVNDLYADGSNGVYMAGGTGSGENLGTTGTHQDFFGGGFDCFILKFSESGFPVWSTLYGGSGNEYLNQMIFEQGCIYLAGGTTSDSLISTPGAFQEVRNGSGTFSDGFIAKFDTTGNLLVGTYLGGGNSDQIEGIDFSDGRFYISAKMNSFGLGTPGTYLPTKTYQSDLYFAQLDTSLHLIWGSYFTGNSHVQSRHKIAVNDDKIAIGLFVYTQPGNTAYATSGTHLDTAVEGQAICVLQFDTSGVNLDWGTFLDGNNYDYLIDIFYPNDSSIYICGATRSYNGIATADVHKPYTNGGGTKFDVFVSCFDQFGQQKWGTYYGGEEDEIPYDAKIDNKNQLVVVGETKSLTGIPYGPAYQAFPSGNITSEGFLFKLDIDRDSLFTDPNHLLANQACPNDIISVEYELAGTFHSNNVFQLWLSDENGDFTNSVLLDEQMGNTNGVFSISLPNLISGGNYRLKVNSTNPVVEGTTSEPIFILNSPETNFTYQVGSSDVYFVDQSLSASSWQWDFGDGATAITPNPSYNYTSVGTYLVQLVSNNGQCSDTATHWIQIDQVAELIELNKGTIIHPNPTTSFWKVLTEKDAESFILYNLNGQVVQKGTLQKEELILEVGKPGVYKLSIYNQKQQLMNSVKLIRL